MSVPLTTTSFPYTSTTATTTEYFPVPGNVTRDIPKNETLDAILCGAKCAEPVNITAVLESPGEVLNIAKTVLASIPNLPDSLLSVLSSSDTSELPTDVQRSIAVISGMASMYGGSSAVYIANIMTANSESLTPVENNIGSLISNTDVSNPRAVAIFAAIATGDVSSSPPQVRATAAVVEFVTDGSLTSQAASALMSVAVGDFDTSNKQLGNLSTLLQEAAVISPIAAAALVDLAEGKSANPVLNILGSVMSSVRLGANAVNGLSNAFSDGRNSNTNTMATVLSVALPALGSIMSGVVADKVMSGLGVQGRVTSALAFVMQA